MTDRNKVLLRQIALWARGRGIPKPTTPEGWKHLTEQFLAERMTPDGHITDPHEEAAWHEVPDEHPTHLVDDGATVQIVDELHEGPFEDDWNHLLRQRAKAQIGPNGELLDDFDTEFQLQSLTREQAGETAPWRNSNPPSSLNNPLGGSANVFEGQDPVQIANWVGDSDSEAQNVTVVLGPAGVYSTLAGKPQAAKFLDAFADVTYGTRGQTVTVRVDVGNGCQFTVAGSAVRVAVGSTLGDVSVTGMLSFREVTHFSPITRTAVALAVPAGGSLSGTVIPVFAKRLRVVRSTTAGFTVTLGNNTVVVTVASSAEMDWLPIPSGCTTLQITDGGMAGFTANAIFELSL